MILTIIVFLLILTVLVVIHEAGHFFVAKKIGIKVEEFGFGIPPRAFGIKFGETIYSINWLPIGGFVKLYGEDDAGSGRVISGQKKDEDSMIGGVKKGSKDIDRAFFSRSVLQRASVIVAGVVMNALLAMVIFYAYLGITGFHAEVPLIDTYHFFLVHQQNANLNESDVIVTNVSSGSPAEKSGMLPHVKILALNGKNIANRLKFIYDVNAEKGKQITLTLQDIHTQKVSNISLIPRISPPKDQGPLGIAFQPIALLSYQNPAEKVLSGITYPINMMAYTLDVMAKLFSISVAQKSPAAVGEGLSGPIGIGFLVGTVLQIPNMTEKISQLLNLAGLLSISLAFFNLLPVPGLDGGRFFFILVEAVRGRKINQKFEETVNTVGMGFLLLLIFVITFKDLIQFHIVPFIK